MNFTDNIPESILENPSTAKLASVLDGLDRHKKGFIGQYVRYWNPATLNDKRWVVEKLHDFGFYEFTTDLPLAVLQQVLLNADTIAATKGSRRGVELYCSVVSLGVADVSPNYLKIDWKDLSPNHPIRGFVTADFYDPYGSDEDRKKPYYYPASNLEEFLIGGVLEIPIESRYFKEPVYDGKIIINAQGEEEMVKEDFSVIIKEFLETNIVNQTIFGAFETPTIIDSPRDEFYFDELLNKNFI